MPRPPQLNSSPKTKVVVLVLENNQGDILLTQRKEHQHLAGYWEFPGGKVEAGESAIEALQRECKEELDYNTPATNLILQVHHDYPSISVELLVFHEISTNPQVNSTENQNMQWVKKTDLSKYKLPAANKTIIQYLNKKMT